MIKPYFPYPLRIFLSSQSMQESNSFFCRLTCCFYNLPLKCWNQIRITKTYVILFSFIGLSGFYWSLSFQWLHFLSISTYKFYGVSFGRDCTKFRAQSFLPVCEVACYAPNFLLVAQNKSAISKMNTHFTVVVRLLLQRLSISRSYLITGKWCNSHQWIDSSQASVSFSTQNMYHHTALIIIHK